MTKPVFGLLQPQQELIIDFSTEIDPVKSAPLVFSASPERVTITSYDAKTMKLKNHSDKNLPFGMVVAPTLVKKAVSLPWKHLVDYISNTPSNVILDQVLKFFGFREEK